MNTLDLASKKVNLKKVASTYDGEWQGPCPACGGTDRFHVWPNQHQGRGSYWCRSCARAGDNIQFLMDFDGMDFKSACAYLKLNIDDYKNRPQSPPLPKKEFQPIHHDDPDLLWQKKAGKFLAWSEQELEKNIKIKEWLAARGITAKAAAASRIGWNNGEDGSDIFRPRTAWGLSELKKENGRARMLWLPRGLVIPYIVDGKIQRLRIRREAGEPRYYVVPGSSSCTMVLGVDRQAFVIVESELDAITCYHAQDLAGAVAVGSSHAKPDAKAFDILKNCKQILNALDYDRAGASAYKWWQETFGDRCDRWPVPKGKDPGEAIQEGVDLRQWIEAGLPPVFKVSHKSRTSCGTDHKSIETQHSSVPSPPADAPEQLTELWRLLRENPGVKIINTPTRFTVLKHERYVGGRINELVMKPGPVNEYLINHPDETITHHNLFYFGAQKP